MISEIFKGIVLLWRTQSETSDAIALWRFIGVAAVVMLLVHFWVKYKTVIGGTKVMAEVVSHKFKGVNTRLGKEYYAEVFSFEFEGETLEKQAYTTTFNPMPIGTKINAYYKRKQPDIIAIAPSYTFDIIILLGLIIGCIVLFLL
ncbi:MAG: hypothetical protein FWE33_08190 [Defluviitaleaceae bacterium]|nr:hypothetical protein [Defluviitaleaceae bacterium]